MICPELDNGYYSSSHRFNSDRKVKREKNNPEKLGVDTIWLIAIFVPALDLRSFL